MFYETKVEPKEYTKIISFIRIEVNYAIKRNDTSFVCTFFDSNKIHIGVGLVYLTPEEYDKWADSDDYIVNLILQKYV